MTKHNQALNIVLFSSIFALLQACGGGSGGSGKITDGSIIDTESGSDTSSSSLNEEPALGEALAASEALATATEGDNSQFQSASSFSSASTNGFNGQILDDGTCLLYTSPSPRDATLSRMPSSA